MNVHNDVLNRLGLVSSDIYNIKLSKAETNLYNGVQLVPLKKEYIYYLTTKTGSIINAILTSYSNGEIKFQYDYV